MNISTSSPVFYANHLKVLSVVGNRVKVQFSFHWDVKDLRSDLTLDEILLHNGDFFNKVSDHFGYVPNIDTLSDFLFESQEDLDWYLADDCNVLVSKLIQDQMRDALDQI